MLETIAGALGLKPGAFISGLIGGLVSFMFFRQLPAVERWATALAGIPCGWYAGAGLSHAMSWGPPTEIAMSFAMAAVGMSLLAAIVKAAPALVDDARRKFFGGKDEVKGGDNG